VQLTVLGCGNVPRHLSQGCGAVRDDLPAQHEIKRAIRQIEAGRIPFHPFNCPSCGPGSAQATASISGFTSSAMTFQFVPTIGAACRATLPPHAASSTRSPGCGGGIAKQHARRGISDCGTKILLVRLGRAWTSLRPHRFPLSRLVIFSSARQKLA